MSIVFGKYLAINAGEYLRFSFENLPVLLAGFAFGPIAGAAVGAVSDLVGCVLVGYAINPIITVGATSLGFVAGFYRFMPKKEGGVSRFLSILAFVLLSHTVGSVMIKSYGLAAYYDAPFYVLVLWRILNYVIVAAADCAVLYLLLSSRAINSEINKILPTKKEIKKQSSERTDNEL